MEDERVTSVQTLEPKKKALSFPFDVIDRLFTGF